MKIVIRDRNEYLVAWAKSALAGLEDVDVDVGSPLDAAVDAIVSPANSFGFMDGGIDRAYSEHFGWDLQHSLQLEIAALPFGELPVGQALVIQTRKVPPGIPFLISAPTMRVPRAIDDPYDIVRATRAAVRAAMDYEGAGLRRYPIASIAMPGMGSGSGRVNPQVAVMAMRAGIEAARSAKVAFPTDLRDAHQRHHALRP